MKCCPKQREDIPPNVAGSYEQQTTLVGTDDGIVYDITNPLVFPVVTVNFLQNGRFVKTSSRSLKPLIWEKNYDKNMCFIGWKLLGVDNNDNETFTYTITKMDKCNNVLEMERIGQEAGFVGSSSQTTQMNLSVLKKKV